MSSSESSSSRQTALKKWDAQFDQLVLTVQSYGSSSQGIQQICDSSSPGTSSTSRDAETSSIESALAHFDKRLDAMLAVEDRLYATRLAFQALRNRSLILVPINRLPPELLSYIFVLCYSSEKAAAELEGEEGDQQHDDEDDSDEEEGEDESPSCIEAILSVCRHWRDTAINTSALWTSIRFAPEVPPELPKLLLKRSKNSAIEVELDFSEEDGDEVMDTLQSTFAAIKDHIPRCAVLDVMTADGSIMNTVLARLVEAEPLPPLRSLTLIQEDGEGELVISSSWTDAPERSHAFFRRIERLHLQGLHFFWNSPIYHDLVSLTLKEICDDYQPSLLEIIAILESCPRLETLCLNFEMSLEDDDDDGDKSDDLKTFQRNPIILKHLRNLKIKWLSPWFMTSILSRIAAPALSFLSIATGEDDSAEHQEPFQIALAKFLVRQTPGVDNPLCTITRFHLQEVPFLPAGIAGLFKLMPFLVHIRAMGCNVDALVLSTIQSENTYISTLYLENFSTLPAKALIELAKRKADAERPIKRLVVRGYELEGDGDSPKAELSKLVNELIWEI